MTWDTPPEARQPLVLVTQSEGAVRIAAVNTLAAAQGMRPGMVLAQARAMLPSLAIGEHDPAADLVQLERIADWADRYTPLVGRAPPDGLYLDLTGAAHLQGGETALLADLVTRLERQGFTARAAIAATPGAAHALARFSGHGTITTAADTFRLLAPLPVAALRIDADIVAALRRVGLKTIGDLASRPRAPLAARFGPFLLRRLDQALGIDEEAIDPRQPLPPATVDLPLAEPIFREEDVAEAIRHLLVRLTSLLAERGQGARAFELTLYRVDGDVGRLVVRSVTPSRDVALLQRLFALRLQSLADPLDAGFGFDHVRLAATVIAPWQDEALRLVDLAPDDNGFVDGAGASRLADKLAARLGADRVLRVVMADTHLPEAVARAVPVHAPSSGRTPSTPAAITVRPSRLFDPPESVEIIAEVPDGPPLRLRWRRRSLKIVAAEGPERIAPEWWREPSIRNPATDLDHETRDYYRVADETGRQLWLFRAGLYSRAGLPPSPDEPVAAPRWFVHGLFA